MCIPAFTRLQNRTGRRFGRGASVEPFEADGSNRLLNKRCRSRRTEFDTRTTSCALLGQCGPEYALQRGHWFAVSRRLTVTQSPALGNKLGDGRGWRGWLRRSYRRLPAPPSTNFHRQALDVDPYDLVPAGGCVLDIGSASLNGQYAFATRPVTTRPWRLITLDLDPTARIDVCGDAHEFEKPKGRHPATFLRLAKALTEQRVDVLHCHDELAWFYGTIASRLAARRIPVLVTMHGRRSNILWRHLLEQRLLARMSEAVICVSDLLRQQILRELHPPPGRVHVIRNGISLAASNPSAMERRAARQTLGLADDAFVLGTVGEHSAVKNLDMLLQATQLALRRIACCSRLRHWSGPAAVLSGC